MIKKELPSSQSQIAYYLVFVKRAKAMDQKKQKHLQVIPASWWLNLLTKLSWRLGQSDQMYLYFNFEDDI